MVTGSLRLVATTSLVLLLGVSHISVADAADRLTNAANLEADDKPPEVEPEPTYEPACKAFCKNSCCFFDNPANECSLCTKDMKCYPGAECYDLNDPARKVLKESQESMILSADGKPCANYCEGSPEDACCNFSDPPAACSGCPTDGKYNCNPAAKCYHNKMEL